MTGAFVSTGFAKHGQSQSGIMAAEEAYEYSRVSKKHPGCVEYSGI